MKGFDDFDLSLGDVMRGERATMGKSLLDVQRDLKIKATYISAIENADPSAFDTPGFVAGYVRSYARYLNLDPDWAFETFCEEGGFAVAHGMSPDASVRSDRRPGTKKLSTVTKPAHLRDPFTEPSVSYLPRGEAAFSSFEPRAILSILVLIALLGGIGYGGWAVLQEVQKVRLTPVEQTPEVLAELDPLTEAVRSDASLGEDSSATVATRTRDVSGRLSRPEALDIPVMAARDGPISAIDPNTIGALAPSRDEGFIAAREPRPDNIPYATPGTATDDLRSLDAVVEDIAPAPVQVIAEADPAVTLFAVRPSWVRVRAADGTVIFEKILDAGERFEVPVTDEAPTLRAGNANALYFALGETAYGPVGTGPEVVKDVVLTAEDVRRVYPVVDPEGDSDVARFFSVAEAQGQ